MGECGSAIGQPSVKQVEERFTVGLFVQRSTGVRCIRIDPGFLDGVVQVAGEIEETLARKKNPSVALGNQLSRRYSDDGASVATVEN